MRTTVNQTSDMPEISPDGIKAAEEHSHQISTEMHNYYTYERKLDNYSGRLVQIMKIIDAARVGFE